MKKFSAQWAGSAPPWVWLRMTLLGEALRRGILLREVDVEGYTEETPMTLVAALTGKGVLKKGVLKKRGELVFLIDGGYASVTVSNTYGRVWAASTKDGVVEAIERIARLKITPHSPKGSIFVLTRGPQGFALSSAGRVDAPLVRENYAPEALAHYDHVVGCLRTNSPCGRLVLLDGSPGTGKSYMIRGFASDVRATFVIVSSSLVGQISGPDVVPVLLNSGPAEEKRGPIVLVLEDADAALVTRERGSLSGLGDVLNIGDGLLGELADLRIIATTNADRVELDPAIMRPGRMCAHIQVGTLSAEAASGAYRRLMGPDAVRLPESSIAEVYRLARADGWEPDRSRPYRAGIYL